MIKNISTMTREELIIALEKETALKHEAGKNWLKHSHHY